LPDGDGDSLPDSWELNAFSVLSYSGTDDPDFDGQDNAFELIAGNDPSSASSCLSMEPASPSPTGGTFRLNRVQPGVRYTLESSSDLSLWDSVSESVFEVEGPGAMLDPRTDTPLRRYYRVTVSPE
jgi:hypothetical protein